MEPLMRSCLVKYDGNQVENLANLDKAKTFCVFDVYDDAKGKFYVATIFGLAIWDGNSWTVKDKKNGLPGSVIREIQLDKKGDLWIFPAIGFNKGLAGKYNNDSYVPVSMNGHSGKAIKAVFEDNEGKMWTGMHMGNAASFDGTNWIDYTNSAKCKHISQIAQDKKGRIWIAGIEGKFACFDNGKWKSFKYGSGYFSPYAAPLMTLGLVPGIIAGYIGPDLSSWGDIVTDKNSDAWFLARKRGVVVSDGENFESAEKKYAAPKTILWLIAKVISGWLFILVKFINMISQNGLFIHKKKVFQINFLQFLKLKMVIFG
jgi:hypothetical protein